MQAIREAAVRGKDAADASLPELEARLLALRAAHDDLLAENERVPPSAKRERTVEQLAMPVILDFHSGVDRGGVT